MTIKNNNEKLYSFFIEKAEPDLNFRDKSGKSALMYASETDNYDLIELLLRKGADANLIDKQGQTALIYASKNDHILCVESLLRANEINVKWRDHVKFIIFAFKQPTLA